MLWFSGPVVIFGSAPHALAARSETFIQDEADHLLRAHRASWLLGLSDRAQACFRSGVLGAGLSRASTERGWTKLTRNWVAVLRRHGDRSTRSVRATLTSSDTWVAFKVWGVIRRHASSSPPPTSRCC